MANDTLAHPDEHLYKIHLKNLEAVYHKIIRSIAYLTLLLDWVTESDDCTLSLKKKGMVDAVLSAAVESLEQTMSFLPEL